MPHPLVLLERHVQTCFLTSSYISKRGLLAMGVKDVHHQQMFVQTWLLRKMSAWRLSVVSVLSLCPRIWVRAELLLFEWKPNIGELLGSLGYGKGCVVESCW